SNLGEWLSRPARKDGTQAVLRVVTSCFHVIFALITTSCKLRYPFLACRCEPQGFGLPAGRATDDNQAPCLQGMQTMADIALVAWQGTHQLLVTTGDDSPRALVIRG